MINFLLKTARLVVWSAKGNFGYSFGQFPLTNALRNFYLHLSHAKIDKLRNKAVIFNFGSGKLERYMFNLMNTYSINGYTVFLKPNYRFYSTCENGYTSRIFSFLNVYPFLAESQVSQYDTVHVVNLNSSTIHIKNISKEINISLDGLSSDGKELSWPFSFHPTIYVHNSLRNIDEIQSLIKEAIRENNRRFSLFFGGQIYHESYKTLKKNFPDLLNRNELFEVIFRNFDSAITPSVNLANMQETESSSTPIAILDRTKNFVPPDKWFKALGNANFFICPPGFEMPMCHNVIEAMACGSIPIIQYGHFFTPKLEHDRNCLTFKNDDELVEVIQRALKMSSESISEMRENVLNYYECHLNPKIFLEKIEDHQKDKIEISVIAGKFSL